MMIDDISTAWAIVRAFPGKEKLMLERFRAQRIEVFAPVLMRPAPVRLGRRPLPADAMVPASLFPGYVFVRPDMGRRHLLVDQVYVAHHLHVVLFDVVIEAIRDYADEAVVMQAASLSRRKALSGKRVVRSFAEIVNCIADEPVDSNRLTVLFDELKAFVGRTRVTCAATFDQYLRTDEAAP